MKYLLRQAAGFIGLSGIGWILDFCTYIGLGFFSKSLVLNNTMSSWVGISFVFIFATEKVFKNSSRIRLKWKYVIYILYQAALIFLISRLLGKIDMAVTDHADSEFVREFSSVISKILVTPVTMVLNFFMMKGVIEKI